MIAGCCDGSFRVVGGGLDAEVEYCAVFFILMDELVSLLGKLSSDEQDHDTTGKGIEGASMADLLDAGQTPKVADETERGLAGGLV